MKIGIAGAGSFGTAIAAVVARATAAPVTRIALWDIDIERLARMRESRRHDMLPGLVLDERIVPTPALADLADAEVLFVVTPSAAMREVAGKLALARVHGIVVSCTKGIEHGSLLRMSEILARELPQSEIAVLSGPSHAEEMAAGVPTAVMLGCRSDGALRRVEETLSGPTFIVEASSDVAGIELGGALKNCYAIAAGLLDGLQYGVDAKAILMTAAIRELARLGESLGGRHETFYGLGGLGDLAVTCFSPYGRNRLVGERLARGERLEAIIASMAMVAEGVPVTRSLYDYATRQRINAPLLRAVHGVLFEGRAPGAIADAVF